MSRLDTATIARLQSEYTISVGDVSDQHLAAIRKELLEPPSTAAPKSTRRRRLSLVLVVALLVIPVGAAVASEGAVPGDVLYPVKLIIEPLVEVFDSDVKATHRVEELTDLVDQPAADDMISDAVREAEREVDGLEPDHPLRDELGHLTDRIGRTHESSDDAPTPDPGTSDRDPAPRTTEPRDGAHPDATTTTTLPEREQDQVHDTTTTTASDSRGDDSRDG